MFVKTNIKNCQTSTNGKVIQAIKGVSTREIQQSSQITNIYKCVLLGDANVGKTLFTQTICSQRTLSQTYLATNSIKVHKINTKNKNVDLFDVPPRFDISHINVDAVIIVFSLTSRISFDNLSKWIKDAPKSVPILIVATHKDIFEKSRAVTKTMIDNFLSKYDVNYTEVQFFNHYSRTSTTQLLTIVDDLLTN